MGTRDIPPEWRSASDLIAIVRDLGGRALAHDLDARFADGTMSDGAIEAIHWPAMMMAFQAEPSTLLYGIAVGDHVNFRLKSATETGVIVALDKQ